MKSFDLLRYLKKWWFLIMLITAVGCLGVYEFISSRQSYTATAIIQYTNANASQGRNADGSKIDPTEITSASVINQTIQQLGLTASTESIRSKISVKEVIPEDEQTKKETALADGEEYEYHPTIYAVSFTVASKDATDYARNVLDAVLTNYFKYYSETHVDSELFPNNASNVSVANYEYIDCVEILRNNANESVAYLRKKADEKYGFYSVRSGYSFSDLVSEYEYLTQNTLNDLYAYIVNHKLVRDHMLLVNTKKNIVMRYQLQIDSLNGNIAEAKSIIDQFGDKTLDGAAVYSGNRNADGGETQIVSDVVRDSSVQPSGNVTTTYDKLIQNYADLHARLIDATIVQGQAQEILNIYADVTQDTDPRSAEAQWASARIDELVQKFTSLYDLALMTIDEFNQVNGADNIEMKNSVVVTEKLNLKLYAALSVVLFLFVGCFCAIFLGRLGDFVDYYLYVDKKSGLPNRERCDAAIDHYSTTRLKGQFTIICIQLDFSAMSRNDGDKALRLLGDQLQYVFRTLGFVGYNGAGRFIVLLENCSFDLAKNCVNRLGSLLAKTEFARFGPCIFVGVANSTKDNAYEIRALLRLSIRRCADAKARQEAENAKNAAASPLVSKS